MTHSRTRTEHELVAASALLVMGLAVTSCDQAETALPTQQDSDVAPDPSVRTAAASALRDPQPGGPREITRSRARRLATIWIRDFAPTNADAYEEQRGAPIAWTELDTCGPTRYVATPFQDPGRRVPLAARRGMGSWWLVTFCAHGEPQMSVAVSAWNADLRIEDETLRFPRLSGNHFVPRGIPPETKYDDIFLLPKGRALQMAREVTGRKIRGHPELVAQPNVMPQFAHWRIKLAGRAELHVETRGRVEREEVFVGSHGPQADGRVAVAADAAKARTAVTLGYYDEAGRHRSVKVEARPGYPLEKHVVRPPPLTGRPARMHASDHRTEVPILAIALLAAIAAMPGCDLPEVRPEDPRPCDPEVFNDNWEEYEFQATVSQPDSCPVALDSVDQRKDFTGDVSAPTEIVFDADGFIEVHNAIGGNATLSSFGQIDIDYLRDDLDGLMRGHFDGAYSAGHITTTPVPKQDSALFQTEVDFAPGSPFFQSEDDEVRAAAVLPYFQDPRTEVVGPSSVSPSEFFSLSAHVGNGKDPLSYAWYGDGTFLGSGSSYAGYGGSLTTGTVHTFSVEVTDAEGDASTTLHSLYVTEVMGDDRCLLEPCG